jgi:hypothetical protein
MDFLAFPLLQAGSVAEAPTRGGLEPRTAARRSARRAAKYLGTSIFLIRLIAAPIVLLLA